MLVGELRAILEHLPDDLEVHMRPPAGAPVHVRRVIRKPREHVKVNFAQGSRWFPGQVRPGTVMLESGEQPGSGAGVLWFHTPPPIELHGTFARRAALDEIIG